MLWWVKNVEIAMPARCMRAFLGLDDCLEVCKKAGPFGDGDACCEFPVCLLSIKYTAKSVVG